MFVVPVAGDKIQTHEGDTFTVSSYTNYKTAGPAVYASLGDTPPVIVYYSDIVKINGVPAKLGAGKVFVVAGRIKRTFHLPQPGDAITVRQADAPVDLKVSGYRLHSKTDGLSKGLVILAKNEEGKAVPFRLDSIVDVSRAIGNDLFDRTKFLRYYQDYRGYTGK
jgi:hypothetical protein